MCENKLDNEYDSLRDEIIHSDKFCFTIITSLFTLTTIFYGFLLKSTNNLFILLPAISLICFIGFFYITDKRFVILRIVGFFMEKYSPYNIWDKWNVKHSGKIKEYKKDSPPNEDIIYPRINPYTLEFSLIIGIMGINLVLSLLHFSESTYQIIFPIVDANPSIVIKIATLILTFIPFIWTIIKFCKCKKIISNIEDRHKK